MRERGLVSLNVSGNDYVNAVNALSSVYSSHWVKLLPVSMKPVCILHVFLSFLVFANFS